jgi:hypothetical protein
VFYEYPGAGHEVGVTNYANINDRTAPLLRRWSARR